MVNPAINQKVVMERIAKKVEAAVERMGRLSAPGTQGVLRYGDRILVQQNLFQDKVKAAKEYVN